jgi:hypothetical protein
MFEIGDMATKQRKSKKKYFTPAEANNMLPLVRAIVKDVMELAHAVRDRQARLERLQKDGVANGIVTASQLEEEEAAQEVDLERLEEFTDELADLGVELKDFLTGLIDFPCWMDGREVYLCWKYGEAELGWWHEVNAGFRGRQPLEMLAAAK